jgi:hypothetical protein
MYLKTKSLNGFTIQAQDGKIRSIDNLYFEKFSLNIRYINDDTRTWFPEGKVMLRPEACTSINIENQTISCNKGTNKKQSKNQSTYTN